MCGPFRCQSVLRSLWHALRDRRHVIDLVRTTTRVPELSLISKLHRYCQSDVDILCRCCLESRELFMQITDVDPFASCFTFASACNYVFREDFLTGVPPHGYRRQHNQSVIALRMLVWILQRDYICTSLYNIPGTMVNTVLVVTL